MVVNDEELFYQHETYIKKADNLLIKKMTGIFSPCKNSFKETKKKWFRWINCHITTMDKCVTLSVFGGLVRYFFSTKL